MRQAHLADGYGWRERAPVYFWGVGTLRRVLGGLFLSNCNSPDRILAGWRPPESGVPLFHNTAVALESLSRMLSWSLFRSRSATVCFNSRFSSSSARNRFAYFVTVSLRKA
jgi:hypothetical protein